MGRRPKLVSLQGVEANTSYYLLIQGIKKGPFELAEIIDQVDRGLSLSTLTSCDKGETWIKLFEHHQFDRRIVTNNEELPFTPDKKFLDGSLNGHMLKGRKKAQEEEDAIVGLAFIGKGNDKGQKIQQTSPREREIANQNTISQHNSHSKSPPLSSVFKKV